MKFLNIDWRLLLIVSLGPRYLRVYIILSRKLFRVAVKEALESFNGIPSYSQDSTFAEIKISWGFVVSSVGSVLSPSIHVLASMNMMSFIATRR